MLVAVNEKGNAGEALRVPHEPEVYRQSLTRLPAQPAIAVEASGHYSWVVDEIDIIPLRACKTDGSSEVVIVPSSAPP